MNSGYYVHEKPTQKPKLQPKKEAVVQKKTVTKLPYDKKTDTFDGGSKKELTVTAPKLKPKTQVNTPTKQEVKPTQKTTTPTKQATTVNNQKATVKPKEEVKTAPKQTYLKPKGEVNQKVIDWQNKLKAEGFDLGKVDGIWGNKTEKAYQAYLTNKQTLEKVGLPETNKLSIKDNAPFTQERAGFNPNSNTSYNKLKDFGTSRPNLDFMKMPEEELDRVVANDPELFNQLYDKYIQSGQSAIASRNAMFYKKGGAMKKKSKKCSCGCAMKISKNAKGGLIESCACGCGMKHVNKAQKGTEITERKYTNKYPSGSRTYQEKQTTDKNGNQYQRFINTDNKTNKSDTSYHVVNKKYDPNTFKSANRAYSTNEDFNKTKNIVENKLAKKQKGGKVTTNDSIQAYNRINAGESESGKGPKDKKEVIGQVRKGNFGPGNTKATFNKELKNKK